MAPVTASPLLLEEPIRLASILEHSHHARIVPSLTKIVGTVGGNSRTAEQLQELIEAGMTTARFDLSYHDVAYHLESLENLKAAMAKTKKLCAVMVDTRGPEVTIANPSKESVLLEAGSKVVVGERGEGERSVPSSTFLPVSVPGLAKAVQVGKEIFVGQYLFTGSETTSVWLHVTEVKGDDIVCEVMNTASIKGSFFTVHAADVTIPVPTVSEGDKARIVEWISSGNRIDILSLSFTRFGKDVKEMRAFLESLKLPWKCHIYAKIGNIEGLKNFDSIVEEADGIILARGNLGIDVPAEKVFLFQKAAIHRCNMAGKPAIISRVVDTMCDTPRPTRAEATDVANAVLDGVDGIMLGAETLRGLYPTEAVKTVELICAEAEKVFNQPYYFKQALKAAPDPMTELESICSSAVDSAENVHASCILVFTSSGRTARMVAKYRPTMPTLVVVVPRLSTNQLTWSFSGETQARQALTMRGLFPILAEPKTLEDGDGVSNESLFRLSMERAKALDFIRRHDRVVVVQKLKTSAVVRIVEA